MSSTTVVTESDSSKPVKPAANRWIPADNAQSLSVAPFALIPAQLLMSPDVGASELRVFACLALHADRQGYCNPSQSRIAEMCGFAANGKPDNCYVSTVIRKLKSLGWLTAKRAGAQLPERL